MRWRLVEADCVEAMAAMPDASVDAIVTDPPYGLRFMGAAWDTFDPATMVQRVGTRKGNGPPSDVHDGRHKGRSVSAFANPAGEAGSYDFTPAGQRRFHDWTMEWATEALRALKPGGHLLAFGGTRTYHRLTSGIEDAGFEIRDTIAWLYGSGFPKSLNLARDERVCACGLPGRSGVRTGPEPYADDHTSTVAPSASPRADALAPNDRPVTHTPSGSPSDCPQGRRDHDGRPRLGEVDDQAPARLPDDVPARTHLLARDGGHPERGSSHNPARPHSGLPSMPNLPRPAATGSGERSDTSGSTRPCGAGQTDSESASPERRSGHMGESRAWAECTECGKPIVKGWGTALKPAFEPVVVARKPLSGTVAANVLAHGTGALNVDGCRVATDDNLNGGAYVGEKRRRDEYQSTDVGPDAVALSRLNRGIGEFEQPVGRWPANVAFDEAAAAMLDEQTGELHSQDPATRNGGRKPGWSPSGTGRPMLDKSNPNGGDAGGASRFFYCAKASRAERNAGLLVGLPRARSARKRWQQDVSGRWVRRVTNRHPTVKPSGLMRWLVRLVTPPGGVVLDPFAGSGSTGVAAMLEGADFIGVERDAGYVRIAEARIGCAERDPAAFVPELRAVRAARRPLVLTAEQHGLFDDDDDDGEAAA